MEYRTEVKWHPGSEHPQESGEYVVIWHCCNRPFGMYFSATYDAWNCSDHNDEERAKQTALDDYLIYAWMEIDKKTIEEIKDELISD